MVATTKIKQEAVLLAEMGAFNVFSFKGQPCEVGIIVPISQKKKLRLADIMGTVGTGTQVSGCENNALPISSQKRLNFVIYQWREDPLCHGEKGAFNSRY